MESPPHTMDNPDVQRYIKLMSDRCKIKDGDIVRVNTSIALLRMMGGYDGYSELDEKGKEDYTIMKLCDGRSIWNLPQYVYGIVVEGTVDLTGPRSLKFFEIDFFGESLLRSYGIDCVCNHAIWEYDVSLVKRSTDSRMGNVWRYPGFKEMFLFHPIHRHWVKKICAICHTPNCVRMRMINNLVDVYTAVSAMENIGNVSRKKILRSWYKAQCGREILCIETELEILYPDEIGDVERGYVTN